MKIVIKFKNGKAKIYSKDQWDEQGFVGDFYCIKKDDVFIGYYNNNEIFSVELLEDMSPVELIVDKISPL